VTITINEDKQFRATGGKNLLRTLFENNYFIPSACGGKGTCGYCRVKVTAGGGDALPTEALILSTAEVRQGFRLACQLKVRQDMRIYVPPEYLEIREYEGEIIYAENATSDIRRIGVRLISPGEVEFKPGQYVQVNCDVGGQREYRAYSIASSPDETGVVELNVKRVPEGLVSAWLHTLEEGDRIEFSGPYGDFFLDMDSQRRIICVAGGVGLAPLRSIVLYWVDHLKGRPVELYYGSRTREDLYDHDLFARIAEQNENFHYHPAVSDEDPSWEGERGFIHTVLQKHFQGNGNAEAYLCGPPIMIDAVSEVLVDAGMPEERISYDKF
jgi:Na+-transporting NADH:ubiquinone oxidoreductase subunit F